MKVVDKKTAELPVTAGDWEGVGGTPVTGLCALPLSTCESWQLTADRHKLNLVMTPGTAAVPDEAERQPRCGSRPERNKSPWQLACCFLVLLFPHFLTQTKLVSILGTR